MGFERVLRRALLMSAVAVALAACGSDDGSGPSNTGGAGNGPGCEGRGEQFIAGMTKTSTDGSTVVKLVRSDVVPPAQGLNAWTFEVTDAQGQPVTGATLVANSSMPDHTHPPIPKVATESQPGTYEVTLAFSMPGFWKIEVKVPRSDGSEASVLFAFCIA